MIISAWILVILTILAIGIGHRVSIALRLSGYQRDKVKAYYLAKAGINKAITELEKDANNYDALNESWSDNKDAFEKIVLNDNQNEYAQVSYTVKEADREETKFGVIDEERKININTAPKELLAELLEESGIVNSSNIADNICAWRGDSGVNVPEYSDLGYSNKADKFANIEELILIKDIDNEIYRILKSLITVHSNGKINMNTASQEMLNILVGYCIKQLESRNVVDINPEGLVEKIIELRLKNTVFTSSSDLEAGLGDLSLHAGPKNILNELYRFTDFKSSCFYIVSNGKIRNTSFTAISCIFDRDNKKIVYWHER